LGIYQGAQERKTGVTEVRRTQSSLPRVSLANQTDAAARTEGGVEINLHSKHCISTKYLAIGLKVALGLEDLGFGVGGFGVVEEVGSRRGI